MAKNERLKEAIKEIKYRYGINQKEIVARMGLSSATYLSDLISGKSELSELFIDKLVSTFPELDKNWLLTGNGEILKSSVVQKNKKGDNNYTDKISINKQASNVDRLLDLLKKKDEQIDRMLTLIENLQNK